MRNKLCYLLVKIRNITTPITNKIFSFRLFLLFIIFKVGENFVPILFHLSVNADDRYVFQEPWKKKGQFLIQI